MTKNTIAAIGSVCALLLCAPHSFGDALSLSGTSLNVTGPTTLQGSLNVTGSTTLSTLDVTGVASLQDLTLRDLIVSGATDISGNLLYFGSWLDNPDQHGVSLLYTDRTGTSTPSQLTFSATRPLHAWSWEHEKADQSGMVPTMRLDANHVLTIYNTAGNPGIVLDPANSGGPTNVLTQQVADSRYVSKETLSVGTASSTEWGWGVGPTIAFAGGTATGYASIAGVYATASGENSIATGLFSLASGYGSIASGEYSTASGACSIASGIWSTASGGDSIASGRSAYASGWSSLAEGYESSAFGDFSRTSSFRSYASGTFSTAAGVESSALGYSSSALGALTTAQGCFQTAIGSNNVPQGNPTVWVSTDDLFIVGNGTFYGDSMYQLPIYDENGIPCEGIQSNAFVVKKNGDTTVYGKLTVSATDGSTAATPSGFSIAYNDGTDGAGSSITQQASRPSSVWNWQRTSASGSATSVMQLDASNRLILTGTASANPPLLILDPNGTASINGSSLLTKTAADSLYLPSTIGLSTTNGNVGVGTNTPGAKLQVNVSDANTIGEIIQATTSGTADLQQWQDSNAKVLARIDRSGHIGIGATPSSSTNIYSIAKYSGTSNTSAHQFEATYSPQVDVFDVNYRPINAELFITSDKRITQTPSGYPAINCVMAGMAFNGNGNTQKAGGYVSRLGILSNSHTVGDLVNFYASSPFNAASGVITNMYGVYIAGQKQNFVTNGYGVYQAGSADINYFAGNLGVGTTTPQAKLDVNGSAKISGNLSISGTGSLTLPDGMTLSGSQTLANIVSSGTAAYALASTTAAVLSGTIQPSQVDGLAPVATGGTLDYAKLNNAPTNLSAFANDAGYVVANGTATNLALSGTTNITGQTNISGPTRISGGFIVTGTMDSATNTIVVTSTNQLVLIPQQGDLSMGAFTNGARPQ